MPNSRIYDLMKRYVNKFFLSMILGLIGCYLGIFGVSSWPLIPTFLSEYQAELIEYWIMKNYLITGLLTCASILILRICYKLSDSYVFFVALAAGLIVYLLSFFSYRLLFALKAYHVLAFISGVFILIGMASVLYQIINRVRSHFFNN